jgi:transposase-like protein
MALHVFVFLLLVCYLLSLALLWRLGWFPLRPSSSRGGAKRATLHRLLKPRCPHDCPACRLASTASSVGEPAPVRPWREMKSRRGAPKRVNTEGFACPNPKCPYFGSTDDQIHALVGDGKHGRAEQIQTFRCQACLTTFTARRHTPLYHLKTPSYHVAMVLSAIAEGLDPSAAERVFGYRQATITPGYLAQASTLRRCTSTLSATSSSRMCSWMNCEHGSAAVDRCSGSGWPLIPARKFCLYLSSAPARKTWPIG